MNRKNSILEKNVVSALGSVYAIIIGLLAGLIILVISNPSQAIPGFMTILMGGFTGGAKGLGTVIFRATPIMLSGLAVGFAFKTGLFNIGPPGQMIVGGFAAIYVGIRWTFLPSSIHWAVALAAALIAGGIWATVPGILKAYCNVSEVISSIMMNYIGMYLVNYGVKLTVFDALRNQSRALPQSAQIPKMGLDTIFPGSSANAGFFVAMVAVAVIYVILYKTTFGYELTACGLGRDAADYAGINSKRNIVLSMVISGALAGLGGGLLYLTSGKHIEVVDVLISEGFNGIPVALLGLSNPIGIFFSAIFMAHLGEGGFYLQSYDYKPEVISIIIALIIYFSAFALVFNKFASRFFKEKKKPNSKIERRSGKDRRDNMRVPMDGQDVTVVGRREEDFKKFEKLKIDESATGEQKSDEKLKIDESATGEQKSDGEEEK